MSLECQRHCGRTSWARVLPLRRAKGRTKHTSGYYWRYHEQRAADYRHRRVVGPELFVWGSVLIAEREFGFDKAGFLLPP